MAVDVPQLMPYFFPVVGRLAKNHRGDVVHDISLCDIARACCQSCGHTLNAVVGSEFEHQHIPVHGALSLALVVKQALISAHPPCLNLFYNHIIRILFVG